MSRRMPMEPRAVVLREERPDDITAIREVVTAAFGGQAEATLVDALRDATGSDQRLFARPSAARDLIGPRSSFSAIRASTGASASTSVSRRTLRPPTPDHTSWRSRSPARCPRRRESSATPRRSPRSPRSASHFRFSASSSSSVRGQSRPKRRDKLRSARSLPSVWQRAQ